MHSDPRQWKVVIDGRVMTGFEELVNLLSEAGFRVESGPKGPHTVVHNAMLDQLRADAKSPDRALLTACAAIPDITLSKWACGLGGHWEPVRHALRAARFDQGLNLDASHDEFDGNGWLRCRRQQAPSPDYRTSEAVPPQPPAAAPALPENWTWNAHRKEWEYSTPALRMRGLEFLAIGLDEIRSLLATQEMSIVRSVCVPEERFGQCVRADATWAERVESAAAMLMLAGPADLLAALRDAGIHIVEAKP